jgi:endonuclease/exonuclease/phosphatase (EEP) superfamily protein YafD
MNVIEESKIDIAIITETWANKPFASLFHGIHAC